MPLTVGPVYDVTVSLVDRDRNVSTITTHIPSAMDIADIQTAIASTLIPGILGISDALVKSWSITRSAVDDTAASDAPETSDVERKGVFSFRADDGSAYVINVPSIKNTVVIDRTNLINIGDTAVAAFIAAIVTGGTGAAPSSYLASDILLLDHARKMHRGSRRG